MAKLIIDRVSLQIASITHWLPEQPEVEGDPRASENEQLEVHKAAERDHQMAVEEDDADRDILWPMEQVSLPRENKEYRD